MSASALALVSSAQSASAQQVLLNGVPVAGSPNVVNQVAVPDGQTLQVDPGASVITAGDAVRDAVDGTTITVNNDGTITSTGADGVDAANSTLNLINTGTISADDDAIFATTITSLINNDTITSADNGVRGNTISSLVNNGTITGTAGDAIGAATLTSLTNNGTIFGGEDGVDANIGTLVNNGTISSNSEGVESNIANSIVNNGTISGGDFGIFAGTEITSLTNNGSITGGAIGVLTDGPIRSLTNFGTITGGNGAVNSGIDMGSGTVVNSGTISGRIGIRANRNTAGDADITNSGTIEGTGGTAIDFQNSGGREGSDTLTLLPGSRIIGLVDFNNTAGTTDRLNVGNGLNVLLNAPDAAGVPDIVNANGAPSAISGTQVAVVDPTNFSTFDESLADLTGGISTSVLNRLSGLRNGVSGVTRSAPMAVGYKDGGDVADYARQYWSQTFGTRREQDGDGPSVDSLHKLYGLVSGMDAAVSNSARAGFFFGGSWGDVSARFNSQDTEAESFFGGAYVSTLRGRMAIDAAITLGYTDFDRERNVANNLVAGGLENATADYDGFFVSPEVTFTRAFWPMGRRLEKSLTLRYAGLFLDGFTEIGTAAPLTVNSRDVHIGQARVQLSAPLTYSSDDGSTRSLRIKGGAEVRTQFGDRDVSGALLAQNITFDPGGERTVTGGFVGLSAEHITANGFTFHASAEALFEDDGSKQLSGKAGVKFRF